MIPKLETQHDSYEGWRVIYRHKNIAEPAPDGRGCVVKIVPDEKGPYFTTVARCPTQEWAERFVAAIEIAKHYARHEALTTEQQAKAESLISVASAIANTPRR